MNMISFPSMFNKNNKNTTTRLSYGYDSINESIRALFYVNKGELLGDPSYGTTLIEQIFELKTTTSINEIKQLIIQYINTYIPRIYITTDMIKIYANANDNKYKITIRYMLNPNSDYSYFEIIV